MSTPNNQEVNRSRSALLKKAFLYFFPPFLLIGLYIISIHAKEMHEERLVHEAEERLHVEMLSREISHKLSNIAADLNIIAAHQELAAYLELENPLHLLALTRELSVYSVTRTFYDQIRLIDHKGRERIRINHRGGRNTIVSEDFLLSKKDRYYFNETMALAKGEIYLSAFDLNIENGKVEQALKPVIRVATPLFNSRGQRKGLLILNYLGSDLISHLNEHPSRGADEYLLVDSDDFWLRSPANEAAWQFIYRDRGQSGGLADNLASDQVAAPERWPQIDGVHSGHFYSNGALTTFTTIDPRQEALKGMKGFFKDDPEKVIKPVNAPPPWQVISMIPTNMLYAGSTDNLQKYLLGFGFFTLLSGAGSFALARTSLRREEAEKKLREEVKRYADLFQHANDAIFIIDPETRHFLDVNETAAQQLGYTRQELLHLKLEDLYLKEDTDRNAAIIKTLKEKGAIVFEHVQVRKDGSKVPVEVSSRLVHYGNRPALQSFVRNISERKQADKVQEDLLSELEKRNAELERFTYTVSHDLKSPLVTIKGFLGLLKEDIASEAHEEIKSDLSYISDAVGKMEQLLRELLELSRIGRVVNASEPISISTVAREWVDSHSTRIAEKQLKVSIGPDLPIVHGDPVRIGEVLENLLDNALKYMGAQPAPLIKIGFRENDDHPIITVSDNGMGIDPRYHKKIFALFHMLDPTTEGTGIGLAIVKRIIEVHGGQIWLESKGIGYGSTFCFTLSGKDGDDGNIERKGV